MSHLRDSEKVYSPSEILTFMKSPFASAMDMLAREKPELRDFRDPEDALMKSLQDKGYVHEAEYVSKLQEQTEDLVEIDTDNLTNKQALEQTIAAMRAGAPIITQARLAFGQFAGFADFLVRVEGKSDLGDYYYEAHDTKLSKQFKPYFAIQLCCYSEMLAGLQGVRPEYMAAILGDGTVDRRRIDNFYAYYQCLKAKFLEFHAEQDGTLPDPRDSRQYGHWSNLAQEKLSEIGHLSLVANIRRTQVKTFEEAGITTMEQLAGFDGSLGSKMRKEVLQRFSLQARLQLSSAGKDKPDYEVLEHKFDPPQGLNLLPPPSKSDIFFDIEGLPSVDGGLEYLWGATYFNPDGKRDFRDFWAHDREQEKQAFSEFICWVYECWLADPTMHVYHYAAYEITAIRKLMGRFGVYEEEVDNLLRNRVFVDLYKVVKGGVIVGEPRYSIKNIEHLYRPARETDVASGGESVVWYESWMEHPDGENWQSSEILNNIRKYNIDDCDSTQELYTWLYDRQQELGIPFLEPEGDGVKAQSEKVTELITLRDNLMDRAEECADPDEKNVWQMLAFSLEYHRREKKPEHWRYFDRMKQSAVELYDDMECLSGIIRNTTEPWLPTARSRNPIYVYEINPEQPYKGKPSEFVVLGNKDIKLKPHPDGTDINENLIGFQYKTELPNVLTLVPEVMNRERVLVGALSDLAKEFQEDGLGDGAIVDFLLRRRPKIKGNTSGPVVMGSRENVSDIVATALALDESYLCIQGPPGAGKTYTAKHIIGALLKQGKKVGISSNGHKAILNLMRGVASYVDQENINAHILKVGGDADDPMMDGYDFHWVDRGKNVVVTPGICVGGTAWAFVPNNMVDSLDYLFVDEAGQVPVANLMAMSRSCKNIILMGDQMQLAQPIQGTHPGESASSCLTYLLKDDPTINEDLGVFLPKTFRMHPDLCKIVSEQVYDGELSSDASTGKHVIETHGPMITKKSGLAFVPVSHGSNTQGSREEVEVISKIVNELLGCSYWPDEKGNPRAIGWDDILFVAPYNYQVRLLQTALGERAKVGSVDKFQGQEAPIVILSMCSSDASESPRGIDFLFSKNRLNVAISRAQALAIVVGNSELALTPVNRIEQMSQVNFFSEIVNTGSKYA